MRSHLLTAAIAAIAIAAPSPSGERADISKAVWRAAQNEAWLVSRLNELRAQSEAAMAAVAKLRANRRD